MHRASLAAAAVAAGTVVAGAVAIPATAAPAPHTVPNTKPAWTAHAKHLGHAAAANAVNARVYLAPKGGLAAEQAAALAVSTPGSASYHKFLTASQFDATYGVTNDSVAAVRSYLKAAGLRITGVGAHNRYVSVTGTVAKAEKAFGTSIETYNHNGRTVQAPGAAVTVPGSIGTSVLTVTGLDTTPSIVKPATPAPQDPPPAGFRNASPCSIYYGQVTATYQGDYKTPLPAFKKTTLPYAPCGYTGPQFRAAYEGNTDLTGAGVTVGILDAYAAPSIKNDANTYATNHGDGKFGPGQFTQTTPAAFTNKNACGPSGWYGEETLDVEAVHAMAPGANIHYYAAASCFDSDFIDALGTIVSDNAVQVVSNSWGDVEANESAASVAAYEQVFMQGTLQGISFMFSSGDNGDELANTGIKQADYPTSDPYVTSVGGTSTAIGANGSLQFEAGWGTEKYSLSANGKSWDPVGYLYGAGGGSSALFNKPAYQNGVVSGARRSVPDVAMDADPNTGMLVGERQQFPDGTYYDEYRIGGTSLASPLFAGMTALALQKAGHSAGLLNPVIYGNTAAFQDVTSTFPDKGVVRADYVNGVDATNGVKYSVRTFGQDSSLAVTAGYDQVTGVGSPTTKYLDTLG